MDQRNNVQTVVVFYRESHLIDNIKSLIGEYMGVPCGKDVFEIAQSYANAEKAKHPQLNSSPAKVS